MLFLTMGVASLWAADVQPVQLPAAKTGQPYAYALETNRPADFEKLGGEPAWLKVTPDGVLTGTPPPGARPVSTISVGAWVIDASGRKSGRRITRDFVLKVEPNPCRRESGADLMWCDAVSVGVRPSRGVEFAFQPEQMCDTPGADGMCASFSDLEKDCEKVKEGRYGKDGCIVQFDRLHLIRDGSTIIARGAIGSFDAQNRRFSWSSEPPSSAPAGSLRAEVVKAIDGSTVFLSGSVLIRKKVGSCQFWSWSVVAQTVDSANDLYYGPHDVNTFCAGDGTVLIVLPSQAIWATVYGIPANTNDPTWRPTPAPPGAHECWTGSPVSGSPSQGIGLCETQDGKAATRGFAQENPRHNYSDEKPNWPLRHVGYTHFIEWIYTRAEEPGVSQGSISMAPIASATKATWDVQASESALMGRGWAGFQFVYEHDRKPADDLNSLTAALTYEYRYWPRPWGRSSAEGPEKTLYWWKFGGEKCPQGSDLAGTQPYGIGGSCSPPKAGMRPIELTTRAGPEWAPAAEKVQNAGKIVVKDYVPRDLNMVAGAAIRVPIVISPIRFSDARLPSQISIAPVEGMEWGTRMAPHPIDISPASTITEWEPREILRQVPGVDAVARWPYEPTRNFLGDKPLVVDYSYRERLLYRSEPYFDEFFMTSKSEYGKLIPPEIQSTRSRSYMRLNFIMPVSAYLQLRLTWQHGSLPPAFQYVGNLWTVGFTFSNPGSAEY